MNSKRLSLSCGKTVIEYRIERRPNRKRTIGIAIDRRNGVVVKAPNFTSSKFIEKVIKEKSQWIKNKLQEVESLGKIEPKQFIDGERFHYLGNDYRLSVTESRSGTRSVCLVNGQRVIEVPVKNSEENGAKFIRNALILWYKKQAEIEIGRFIDGYSLNAGLLPDQFKVKNLKSSWGSCCRKNLSFNWRLAMAPVALIEYVVVHELCHLEHKNHSKDYWQNVSSFLPDFKQRQMTLKQIGPTFDL